MTSLYNVILEYGGLPGISPTTVHLDLGHLPDTGWVVAHKILMSALVPLYLIGPLNWV